MKADRRGPFVVDYLTADGRHFSFWLEGPASEADACDHLAAIRRTAWLEGSDAIEVKSNTLLLWIDGLAVWLKAAWLNWRRR